jgi:hypothetical protein
MQPEGQRPVGTPPIQVLSVSKNDEIFRLFLRIFCLHTEMNEQKLKFNVACAELLYQYGNY